MNVRLVLAGALFALAAHGLPLAAQSSAKPPPPGVKREADVVYGVGGGESLKLDLCYAEQLRGPAPCIVAIHGGAWRSGDKEQLLEVAYQLAQKGYVAATVQYRLCPKHRFPAAVEDVKCAVRYLRAEAERWRLDPQRIGAVGFSAGGHLALLLGVMDPADGLQGMGGHAGQSDKVQAVVSFFGPTDFLQKDLPALSEGLISDFVGFSREENTEIRKRASPVTYVDKGDAPLLLLQGTRDPLVPHSQAVAMAEAMTKAGQPGRVELLLGAGHGWGGDEIARTLEVSLAFFGKHLKHTPR